MSHTYACMHCDLPYFAFQSCHAHVELQSICVTSCTNVKVHVLISNSAIYLFHTLQNGQALAAMQLPLG